MMATALKEADIKLEKDEKADIKQTAANVIGFMKEVRFEFFKITWPSKDQVTKEFISVILLVVVLTSAIFVIDKALEVIVNFFSGKAFL